MMQSIQYLQTKALYSVFFFTKTIHYVSLVNMKHLNFNTLLFGSIITLCIILTFIFDLGFLPLISSVAGILYVALLSERNILNFIIGFISSSTYIIIAYLSKLYGEVIFYLVIDLPMIFISYFAWKRHLENKYQVKSRSLSLKSTIIIFIISIIAIFLYSMVLDYIGGVNVIVDATSTIVSFIATILMALRYREQWYMWVIVYIVSIIMWATTFNLLMLIMSISCFISCFIGLINWKKEEKMEI